MDCLSDTKRVNLLYYTGIMSPFRIWFLAIRPKTLAAAISPVILGSALAWEAHSFHLISSLLCLFCAVGFQICANLANDYFDAKRGTDTDARKGPLRVTQAGLVTEKQMKTAIAGVILLTLLGGLFLVIRGGWIILLTGIASILCSLWYTAGPYPLAYLGLGDVFVFIFFGLIAVSGTYYVQALSLQPWVLILGVLPGLLSVAILTVNNLRDIDEDRLHQKKTLAVRFGKTFAKTEYCLTLFFAMFFPLAYAWAHPRYATPLILSALLGSLLSRSLIRTILTYQTPDQLNPLLGKTGRLLLIYCVTFALSVSVGSVK